ncbi:MAG: 50S ribosomal protein L25/general stress protein Ctc [Porticoccaceae bacterium]
MVDFVLNATVRTNVGKGASRRLRRLENLVPAIIYGTGKEPEMISLTHNEFAHALENEAFYSHIITIDIAGKKQDVIIKDLQRHPAKPILLHADFLRVSKTQKLTTRVPLHFLNEDTCVGVKVSGGIVQHNISDIEIECLPANLPEYIEVDMAEVDMGDIVHLTDIKLPKDVTSVALALGDDHDLAVAMVTKPRAIVVEEDEVATEEGEDGESEGEGDADASKDDSAED